MMTALILPATAQAYVNHGRWVAECPQSCGSARQLDPGENAFQCTECLQIFSVSWPSDPDGIWEALGERALPRTRNWFPEGHPLAERCGSPTGQSPADLRAEQRENEGA